MTGNAWVGVDLDGTLSTHYWPDGGPYEHTRIGEPVPAMVERVKAWLAAGIEVRIFTARVGPQPNRRYTAEAKAAIERWSLAHLGVILPVTATKDYSMIRLYDDRAVQVEINTGRLIGGEQ